MICSRWSLVIHFSISGLRPKHLGLSIWLFVLWLFNIMCLRTCYPFAGLRSAISVLRSPFSILRSPFSVLRSPFFVLRSPFSPFTFRSLLTFVVIALGSWLLALGSSLSFVVVALRSWLFALDCRPRFSIFDLRSSGYWIRSCSIGIWPSLSFLCSSLLGFVHLRALFSSRFAAHVVQVVRVLIRLLL